jgi:hypothetical protein
MDRTRATLTADVTNLGANPKENQFSTFGITAGVTVGVIREENAPRSRFRDIAKI